MTTLQHCLHNQQFVCVLESLPKASSHYADQLNALMAHGSLAGMPLLASLSDRVTPDALDAQQAAQLLDQPQQGLVHFSGKGRTEADLLQQLEQMRAMGIQQLLLLSGDRLPGHEPKQAPVRYLESVCALLIVRQHQPTWLLGAALNPFKYCEEEGAAQYLKAQKKLLAGADFLTLQLGFDISKQQEALHWMGQQTAPKPMLACVMALSAKRASFIKQVPGVVLSPALEQCLAHEWQTDPEHAKTLSVQRLALHIHGLKLMGFAGVHLSGIHHLAALLELEQALLDCQQRIHNLQSWQQAWALLWQDAAGNALCFKPQQHTWVLGQQQVQASVAERLRYHALDQVHTNLFSQTNPIGRAMGWALRQPIWQKPLAASALHQLERGIKRPLVGCDTCGMCRLDQTLYICPETCPKGLANGPCGGTRFNRCEFGDRECIHSTKYRIASSVKQLPILAEKLIPSVPESTRGTSSWPRWYGAK